MVGGAAAVERAAGTRARTVVGGDAEIDAVKVRAFRSRRESLQGVPDPASRHPTVAEYTAEFHRLSLRVQIEETARQQVTRYISGLRPAISDDFSCVTVETLDQASSYAMNVEEKLKRRQEYRTSRSEPSPVDLSRVSQPGEQAPLGRKTQSP